jgi:hypothetical protein
MRTTWSPTTSWRSWADLGTPGHPRGLAALYAGMTVPTLRRVSPACGGSPAAGAALDGAFAAPPYVLGSF